MESKILNFLNKNNFRSIKNSQVYFRHLVFLLGEKILASFVNDELNL